MLLNTERIMSLADKMFSRSTQACVLRSPCREEADRKYVSDLFAADWEVFVIRRDEKTGKHNWFTQCCEAGNMITNVKPNIVPAACC